MGNLTNEVRFDAFTLDLRSGELSRDGVPVKLQEQPFRILVYLLERAGDVVTREELQKALWPEDFVDFDHSLNTAIRKLRAALDDSAENPRFIETLARRGYRFIGPVGVAEPKRRRINWTIPAGLLLALLIAGSLVLFRPRSRTIWTLAVLPFTNSDTGTKHVSDGLTDILIDRLSRLSSLRVMARGTVFDYQEKKLAPAQEGKALGVSAVVTGQLRVEGDAYRIHVELIDVRDGAQLWGESYTGKAAELPSMQDRIATDLSRRLRGSAQPQIASTTNAQANEQYLLGLYAWNRRGKADLLASIQHFQRAIELDPQFAAGYAGLANAWGVLAGNGYLDPREGAINVLTAARRTLELDPNNAEAYASIATTEYHVTFDYAAAERDYKRSLALNPNYATAHQWYSEFLRLQGRTDEAHREIEAALRLDPSSRAVNATACFQLVRERRYGEALAFAAKSAQPLPLCTMSAELYSGPRDRAVLEQRLEQLLKSPDAEWAQPVEIAEAYAMLGRNDDAFVWLDKAFEHRATQLTQFQLFPGFDGIRNDPRFIALARRAGLPIAAHQ